MRYRSGRGVLKLTLVVINLVFFTTQLSYKFYACASVPVRPSLQTMGRTAEGLAVYAFMHGFGDGKFLSLDKRYDSKHIFAGIPLFPGIDPPQDSNVKGFSDYQEFLFIPPTLTPSQRGPPIV